jgi:outer membrane protein assembly factor BamB
LSGARPGEIRWSAPLERCAGSFDVAWVARYGWRAEAAGGRLVLSRGDVVAAYDERTGAPLWRRTLGFGATGLVASAGVVIASRSAQNAVLDARTGEPLWSKDIGFGELVLAGEHVVHRGRDALEGLDARTGRRLWRTSVPDARTTTFDASVVYLNSVVPGRDSRSPVQRRLLRVDAATGHRLAALPLPRPLRVDMWSSGNQAVRGMLVLSVLGEAETPGVPIVETVALDPRTGGSLWSRKGGVELGPELFGVPDGRTYTALEPRTGRKVWTVARGEAVPLFARSGHLVAHNDSSAGSAAVGTVEGLRPHGGRGWSSPPLRHVEHLADTGDTVFVITCDQWPDDRVDLCRELRLTAVAS